MFRLQLDRPHGDQLEFMQVFSRPGEVLPSAMQCPYFFQAKRGGHSGEKTHLLRARVEQYHIKTGINDLQRNSGESGASAYVQGIPR